MNDKIENAKAKIVNLSGTITFSNLPSIYFSTNITLGTIYEINKIDILAPTLLYTDNDALFSQSIVITEAIDPYGIFIAV